MRKGDDGETGKKKQAGAELGQAQLKLGLDFNLITISCTLLHFGRTWWLNIHRERMNQPGNFRYR